MTSTTNLKGLTAYNPVWKTRPARLFILSWFLLNLIQVSFTELTSDEGYYWFYAQHLQWGYYDHPPMIALMIKAGSSIFPGELGVRFFNVSLSTTAIYCFLSLLPKQLKQSSKTYLVILSAPLVHYLTFIIFPDGPLLTFSLLFLVIYKRFLDKQTVANSIFLGLSLMLMAYSKYHGALVLFFTIIANPRLLKSAYFYLAIGIAAIFFAPHVLWQYKHDFPTLKYHLSGRTSVFSFKHVGEYLSQQLVVIGPGLIFIPFVVKTRDVFERTLKVIITGTFIFFLFTSFKTFVHFHWTSIALYPLLYFAVSYYHQPQKQKLFKALLLPFVILFFIIRILLAVPIIPAMHVGEDYYHGRKAWAKEIAAVAGNSPVFIPNNLREASLYSFYSGKIGVTLYSRPEKKSQYELWGYEDSLQGKEVFLMMKNPFDNSHLFSNSLNNEWYYAEVPSFQSFYTGITIRLLALEHQRDSMKAEVEILNQLLNVVEFKKGLNNEWPKLVFTIEKGKKIVKSGTLDELNFSLQPSTSSKKKLSIAVNDVPAGNYDLYFGIKSDILPDAILSKNNAITIID